MGKTKSRAGSVPLRNCVLIFDRDFDHRSFRKPSQRDYHSVDIISLWSQQILFSIPTELNIDKNPSLGLMLKAVVVRYMLI